MADLDNFFAKKDRKKSKGKKFTTTEEIAKKLEEPGKRPEKPKPKDKPSISETEEIQHTEDDEWKEFKEEKKDYTGLKIGNMNIGESTDIESDDESGSGDNSSDRESRENGKHAKPWNKSEPPPEQPEVPVEVTPPPAPTGQPVKGSYKPPHLRNAPAVSVSPKPRGKNIAPDIHSEEYFPTLNSKQPSTESSGAWGRRKKDEGTFEEVRNRGGNKSYSVQEPAQPKLSLGNKYGALSQYQS